MNGPQPVRILVRGQDSGRHEATVIAGPTPVPGLVVNEDPVLRGTWNITHAASGAAVACLFDGPEHALHVATRLAGACDWTMCAAEIAAVRRGLREAILDALDGAGAHHLGHYRGVASDDTLRGSA